MHTSCKGISWFGNICQKFEDMCREVGEIMQQEVIEPAISQLETFCENVENLLSSSEPVGDALSQSSVDLEEGAASDSFLVQNATYENCDKRSSDDGVHLGSVEFVKTISCGLSLEETNDIKVNKFQLDGIYHASQAIELDGGDNMLVPALDDVGGCNSLVETDYRSSNHTDMSSNISDDIQFSHFVNLVEPCKRNPAGIRSCPAGAHSISNYNGATCLTTEATVSPPNGIELHNSFDELKSAMPLPVCNSFDDQSTMPFPESEAWDNDIAKSGLQTLQSLNIKLDESCIKVDGTRIQPISCEEAKCRSYKKKMKEAFASKMRLLKMQNHKQPIRTRVLLRCIPYKYHVLNP